MQEKQAVLFELENAVKNFDREDAVETAKKHYRLAWIPLKPLSKGLTKGL